MTTKTKQIEKLRQLQENVDLQFENEDVLYLAFVHKSFVNESPKQSDCNERLEFLGDAVLELVVTDFLYGNYPSRPEGELTNWRSALVKGKNLARVARKLNLGSYLLLSRGEDKSGGRDKDYILANTVEAFIGAIYLDKGYDTANKFIMKNIISLLEEIIEQGLHVDPKSRLQELAQEKLSITPKYKLLGDSGPDHDKTFGMGVYFGEDLAGQGTGSSKQEAEQDAAMNALKSRGWQNL